MIENNIKIFESAYTSFIEKFRLFELSDWHEKDSLYMSYETFLEKSAGSYFKLLDSSNYSYDDLIIAELRNTIVFEKQYYSKYDIHYSDNFLDKIFCQSRFRLIFFCRILEVRPTGTDITDVLCMLGDWLMKTDIWSLTYLIIERLADYKNPTGLSLAEKFAVRLSTDEDYYHSGIADSMYEYLVSLDRNSSTAFLERIRLGVKGDLKVFFDSLVLT